MAAQIDTKEVAERIHEADSILVITGGDPTIDQLSACISLFDILQAIDKKAVMVYSGNVSPALGFLKPEKIIREDAESLRDFIISFDRSKVDKFRYSQEGDQYNILLTPAHRAVITEKDMKYRKGDFNIDLTVALGVAGKERIDSTISQHSQLMKEIPMISIMAGKASSSLDAMVWKDEACIALCEMMHDLCQALDDKLKIEKQTANAMLLGIVDQTERFKSRRTRPETMHISGELLELGADPYLIAENLALANSIPVELPEAEVDETKEMVADAVGEAGQYDTQIIKGKGKKKSGRSQRLYIRAGADDELAYSKKEDKKGEDEEHKLDQLSIDSDGNLHIIEEEEEENNKAPSAPSPAIPAAAADAKPAETAAAQSASDAGGATALAKPAAAAASPSSAAPPSSGRRNVLTPTGNVQAPHPATGSAAAPPTAGGLAAASAIAPPLAAPTTPLDVSPTALALAKEAGASSPQAPPINELVDRASRPAPPLAANANPEQMHQYIDSLSSAAETVNQPPATSAGQALTVDSYLTQQQAPPAAPAAAPPLVAPPMPNVANQPPPAAPPLPSTS